MALSDGAHNSNSGRKEVEAKLLNNNIDHDGDNVSFSFRYYRTVVMAGWLALLTLILPYYYRCCCCRWLNGWTLGS